LLELAIESRADYIVTFNTRDFMLSGVNVYKAASPAEFLRIIGEGR
jgi:predicted nucleic acid-binding protein